MAEAIVRHRLLIPNHSALPRPLAFGLWTVDCGLWTVDLRLETLAFCLCPFPPPPILSTSTAKKSHPTWTAFVHAALLLSPHDSACNERFPPPPAASKPGSSSPFIRRSTFREPDAWLDLCSFLNRAGRLGLEQQRIALDQAKGQEELEKLFWEWTKRPDVQARLYPHRDPDKTRRDAVRLLDQHLLGSRGTFPVQETDPDPACLV